MDALEFGVGARVSLHPMTDQFEDIISGALDEVSATEAANRLQAQTGTISTLLRGREADLARYLVDLVAAATRRCHGTHLAALIQLSRGCPGEVSCSGTGDAWVPGPLPEISATGVAAQAEWALYPLTGPGERAEHMEAITAAIDRARERGLVTDGGHFVTLLSGDLADIISLVTATWMQCGASVGHVVSHLSLAVNIPNTHQEQQ